MGAGAPSVEAVDDCGRLLFGSDCPSASRDQPSPGVQEGERMKPPTASSSEGGPFHFKHPPVHRATAQHHEAGRQKVYLHLQSLICKGGGQPLPKPTPCPLCSERFAYDCCNSPSVRLLLLCSCVARGKRLTAGWSWWPQGPCCSRPGGGTPSVFPYCPAERGCRTAGLAGTCSKLERRGFD